MPSVDSGSVQQEATGATAAANSTQPPPGTPSTGRRSGALWVRRLRLWTGLTLFTYVTLHLVNHALGLVSLDAMIGGMGYARLVWRNPAGATLLYGALLIHFSLALWAIYQRRRWSLPADEWTRLVLGLSIIPALALHVTGTRIAHALYDIDIGYRFVLMATWLGDPATLWRQVLGLLIAWIHGCIGVHLVGRLQPWYRRWIALFYALAILLPVLALLGFVQGGRAVEALVADPAWWEAYRAATHLPTAAEIASIYAIERAILWTFCTLVVGAVLARIAANIVARRHGLIRIAFPGKRVIEVQRGATILDASRLGRVPHAEVCGGRGRCSTCRVRVSRGAEALPPPSEAERKVLQRIAAAPNVRLACQTRPGADVSVVPLLPPTATARDGFARAGHMPGQERELAILFADIRAFTRLSEHKLPYDVVFLLNRYFGAMGSAVEQSGGRVDKFIGDGVMALFGVDTAPDEACRQALAAARSMAVHLEELNQLLAHDLAEPLRIGIGVHVGPAIVGEMGYGATVGVTAIGDAVNTASRLEGMTKAYGAQFVCSDAVAKRAGVDLSKFECHEIEVRGRQETLAIRVVPEAKELPVSS
ncbi:MAG: adenylate/guanylate cyclase domain-containing protein [Rhodospirillales bacterium]|nr:adenylate/guanylate cyclase domain-containing protein [Rhodospirillales bacterium]